MCGVAAANDHIVRFKHGFQLGHDGNDVAPPFLLA
jgi:hypothetical protein